MCCSHPVQSPPLDFRRAPVLPPAWPRACGLGDRRVHPSLVVAPPRAAAVGTHTRKRPTGCTLPVAHKPAPKVLNPPHARHNFRSTATRPHMRQTPSLPRRAGPTDFHMPTPAAQPHQHAPCLLGAPLRGRASSNTLAALAASSRPSTLDYASSASSRPFDQALPAAVYSGPRTSPTPTHTCQHIHLHRQHALCGLPSSLQHTHPPVSTACVRIIGAAAGAHLQKLCFFQLAAHALGPTGKIHSPGTRQALSACPCAGNL